MKTLLSTFIIVIIYSLGISQSIPLPEHPNPIHNRNQWSNLNGEWDFKFDPENVGIKENWASENIDFNKKITVPFPWGSALSKLSDDADIGWYKRTINVSQEWNGKRIFIIIGASDWETHVWLNGKLLGSHQGGYVPFEFEITDQIIFDEKMDLVIRADDVRRPHTLYGKQGYGNARGIWQTVYLEARGQHYIQMIHMTPDIDNDKVKATAYLSEPSEIELEVEVTISASGTDLNGIIKFQKNQTKAFTEIKIPNPRLWTLDDPYLYNVKARLGDDVLNSYFGMRKIGVVDLPGTDIPYISLNNEPIYLQMALDQSYHPEGFYTFPSDQFMIDEINRSKSIGLNGIRTHIKVEIPRKLYWADKLGLLVMEDLPNSWGEPEEKMQKESTYTLREMIKRDYNHPSIFSWVIINETWGMISKTGDKEWAYLPETQKWLESMYHLTKSLDPSRLVEDNSICCGRGHTVTDINSWHVYLPGYAWDNYLSELSDSTYVGSEYHYEEGYSQGSEPNINSECGNVWGYQGSTGDVDWSWDYHRMINSFRKYPKIGGWLYTEHHDVINEWNGYWRFDRTEKFTGLEQIVPGMSLNDLHSPIYISTGQEICYSANAGEAIEIPIFISSMSNKDFGSDLILEYGISSVNGIGESKSYKSLETINIDYSPWMQKELDPILYTAPEVDGVSTLRMILKTQYGEIVHRNFVHIVTSNGHEHPGAQVISVPPKDYTDAEWSKKTWDMLDGKKVNGAGNGYFEYTFEFDENINFENSEEVYFIVEASAKQLFVKDQEDYNANQDFMKGSKVAPSSNPNSYPMTDEEAFPSTINIYVNDAEQQTIILPDDPSDHRGVLSWHAQPEDGKLREAGSYGFPVKVAIDDSTLNKIKSDGLLKVRLEAVDNGGLAIYGKDFGRYPFNPSLVMRNK